MTYTGGSTPGMNEALGLPFDDGGRMQKVVFAFDVDGTLIDHHGNRREDYIAILRHMHKVFKNSKIVVWSGGGAAYAETIGMRLGLDRYVWKYLSKMQYKELRHSGYSIVAFDDIQDTRLGDVNLIVRQ